MEVLDLLHRTLLIQLHQVRHGALFSLHGVVQPVDHGGLLLLQHSRHVHDFLCLLFLLLNPAVVHLGGHHGVLLHLHVFQGLASLLDFLHLHVGALLVHDGLLPRLLDQAFNLGLLLLNLIPDGFVLAHALALVSLVHELLSRARVVELIAVPVLFRLHLLIELLFNIMLLALKLVHLLHELGSFLRVSDTLGCFLLLLAQLNDSGLDLDLLVLGLFIVIKSPDHLVLRFAQECAHSTLEVVVSGGLVHLAGHADVHPAVVVITNHVARFLLVRRVWYVLLG